VVTFGLLGADTLAVVCPRPAVSRFEVLALCGVALLAAGQLVLFAAFDRRGVNDHDPDFAGGAALWSETFAEAPLVERPGVLWDHLARDLGLHPRLAQTWLVAFCGTFGWNEVTLRLANVPWVLLLVLGTWALGRQVGSVRMALLAAFVVSTLPVSVHMSRKFFIHYHAAALVPVTLALALHIARSPAGARWRWGALGLLLGLRLSSHPVQFADAALTVGALLALGLWRGRAFVAGCLGAALLGVLIASPWLFGGGEGQEGGLAFYLDHAGRYTSFESFQREGPIVAQWTLRVLGRQLWTATLMPPALLLLLIPGSIAAAWSVVAADSDRAPRRALALLFVLQLPVLFLAVTNAGFVADWMYLLPGLVVLCLVGLERWSEGRVPSSLRRLWVAAVIVQGAAVVTIPLVASLSGPDPIAQPEAYAGPVLRHFARSEHGGTGNTHHLVSRGPSAGAQLAAWSMAQEPEREIELGFWSLTYDWRRTNGCSPPDPARAEPWTWQAQPVGQQPRPEPWSMRGRKVSWVHGVAPSDGGPRRHVVTLWYVGPDSEEYMLFTCPTDEAWRVEMTEAATEVVRARFPGARIAPLADPVEWVVGNVDSTGNPQRGYWNVALLVDLSRTSRTRSSSGPEPP